MLHHQRFGIQSRQIATTTPLKGCLPDSANSGKANAWKHAKPQSAKTSTREFVVNCADGVVWGFPTNNERVGAREIIHTKYNLLFAKTAITKYQQSNDI